MEIIYRAFDGKEFNDEDKCKLHEDNLFYEEMMPALLKFVDSKDENNRYEEEMQEILKIVDYKDEFFFYMDWADFAYRIGRKYKKSDKYQESINAHKSSIKLLQKAIELDAKNPISYNKLGKNYLYLEEYQDAIYNFEKAIEYNYKDLIRCYYCLAECKSATNEYQEAINYFQKVIELDSSGTSKDLGYGAMSELGISVCKGNLSKNTK